MTKLYLIHHFSAEVSVMVNHLVFSVGVQIISMKKKINQLSSQVKLFGSIYLNRNAKNGHINILVYLNVLMSQRKLIFQKRKRHILLMISEHCVNCFRLTKI